MSLSASRIPLRRTHALGAAASAGLDDAVDLERRVLAPPNAAMVEETPGIINFIEGGREFTTIVGGEGNPLGLIARA